MEEEDPTETETQTDKQRFEAIAPIRDPLGIHNRRSWQLSKLAKCFKSEVRLINAVADVNAKIYLEVLMLAAMPGSSVLVCAVGSDAEQAVLSISECLSAEGLGDWKPTNE